MSVSKCLAALLVGGMLLLAVGCDREKKGGTGTSSGKANTITIDGSDTMVNLTQAWAEAFQKTHPNIEIHVSGGGSGVGINSLIAGKVDLANSSRAFNDKEVAKFKENNPGKELKENIVGLDALAIYVHKENPLDSISVEELGEIYGDKGAIVKWSQLGKPNPGCPSDEITRVSRQNNSGTYTYFREHVVGKTRDFKNGSVDLSGSKDVVALVANTKCAIGYSGMGYKTADVKWLSVSAKKGGKAIAPSPDSARDQTYPISRPLFVYTAGEPAGALKEFIDWCKGPEGQKIVQEVGYVSLKK
jgi:phosphate transport system substrate-binding protein